MTLAALFDLGVPEAIVQEAVGSLGLPGVLKIEKVRKNGFHAVKVTVEAPHEHKHRHLSHIEKILDAGKMTDGARDLARRMFRRLGEAEAHSHAIPIEKVHFHEVGAIDSIFDFVGVAVALDHLNPDSVSSRAVPTGNGMVQCEHGLLPIPAPATAHLLRGIPIAATTLDGEMTTPTGAAILAVNASSFGPAPAMTVERIGTGAGTRDWPGQPNILRLLWGQASSASAPWERDEVWQVETNIDDAPGERIGYAMERLFAAGALDAFAVPVQMKKQRPGVLLVALVPDAALAAVESALFAETGTLGVRRTRVARSKAPRRQAEVDTEFGPVAVKMAWDGVRWSGSPEYESCAALARAKGVPFRMVYAAAERAFAAATPPSAPGAAS
jgi:uncharacterized protein (TIGR00299 family) protein